MAVKEGAVKSLLGWLKPKESAPVAPKPRRISKKPDYKLYRVRRDSDGRFEEGIYITRDGRFQIARGERETRWWLSAAWMVTIEGEGNDGPISDQQFEDEQLLASLGLDKATFPSREAAVEALRVAVYAEAAA